MTEAVDSGFVAYNIDRYFTFNIIIIQEFVTPISKMRKNIYVY